VTKSNTEQDKAKSNKRVIDMALSQMEDVKLQQTENAWKPARLKVHSSSGQEAITEVCIWNSSIVFQLHSRRVYKKSFDIFCVRHPAILPLYHQA
jgi:hypothetical protein